MSKHTIQLGDKVRDKITGYAGVAIARTEWINGCIRWVVQPPVDKEGKMPDSTSVDEPQLEVTESAQNDKPEPRGGPRPEPLRGPRVQL